MSLKVNRKTINSFLQTIGLKFSATQSSVNFETSKLYVMPIQFHVLVY